MEADGGQVEEKAMEPEEVDGALVGGSEGAAGSSRQQTPPSTPERSARSAAYEAGRRDFGPSRGSMDSAESGDEGRGRPSGISPLPGERPSLSRAGGGSRRHAKLKSSSLPFDTFFALFRVDGEHCSGETLERLRWVLASLTERAYQPGEVVQREGDAATPAEMLVFTRGTVEVECAPRRSSRSAAPADAPAAAGSLEADGDAADAPAPAPAAGEEKGRPSRRSRDDRSTAVLSAPFFVGEERVLRGSWPTATYRVAGDAGTCSAFVLTEENLNALVATGGFDLERTLRLRAFERTIAKHGMHTSVLRDAVFVDHMMSYLARNSEAENLRFLVDLMQFKRDFDARGGFTERHRRFEAIWDAYMRPWDTMANVSAIDCEPALLETVVAARDAAVAQRHSRRLMTVLDPVALRVKRDLDRAALPAFVDSRFYDAFIRERFPLNPDAAAKGLRESKQAGGQRKQGSNGGAAGPKASFKGGLLRRMSVGAPLGLGGRPSVTRQSPDKRSTPNRGTMRSTLNAGRGNASLQRPAGGGGGGGDGDAGNAARLNLREKLANMTSELEEIERRDSIQSLDEARAKLSRGGSQGGKRTTEHAALAASLVSGGVAAREPPKSGACVIS